MTRHEHGMALPLAITLSVVAMVIVVAVMVSSFSSSDRSRDERDQAMSSNPAEEGVLVYAKSLDAGSVGEHTGFSLTSAALGKFIADSGNGNATCGGAADPLCILPNAGTGWPQVDGRAVPSADRLTVRRRIGQGTYRFWQVLAVAPPRFGVSNGASPVAPGGRVVVFIRGWHSASPSGAVAAQARPTIVRAEFRPPRFSDFQILADGKMNLGEGTVINGRVQSNGYDQSLFDQYRTFPEQIRIDNLATCQSTARFYTASGTINALGGNCANASYQFAGQGERANVLDTIADINSIRTSFCPSTNGPIVVRCFNAPANFGGRFVARLQNNGSVHVSGPGVNVFVDATNTQLGMPSGGRMGAVLVFNRSVVVRGSLGSSGRATIIASNDNSVALPEPPSIYFDGVGGSNVGAAPNDSTAAVGLIADGDVIADESQACPLQVRGALVARSGLLSRLPMYRGGHIPGAPLCAGGFKLHGSISAHLYHYLAIVDAGGNVLSGYATREFSYDERLYHNPPPMFPVLGSWHVQASTLGSLSCFTQGAGGAPLLDYQQSGCA